MSRKVFFSFHYERDVWRAGQVRNCNVVSDEDAFGFIDSVDWEKLKRDGNDAVRQWINSQLIGTSVTVVLIGYETSSRSWVQYEILKSWNRGNGIVGVWIHSLKDQDSKTDPPGRNPFEHFQFSDGTVLSSVCKAYDWTCADGRIKLGEWLEEAAEIRANYGAKGDLKETPELTAQPSKSFTIPQSPISVGFAPKAPWCQGDAERER